MELLCDSEHERLRAFRHKIAAVVDGGRAAALMIDVDDITFLLRYVGELEHELWSRDH